MTEHSEHMHMQIKHLQKEIKRLRDKYEPGQHIEETYSPTIDSRDHPEEIQYE
tara:strand:- start:2636 stop:2794 length:159 start_codon:yes stop_codon:yes gene_type:complete